MPRFSPLKINKMATTVINNGTTLFILNLMVDPGRRADMFKANMAGKVPVPKINMNNTLCKTESVFNAVTSAK